MKKTLIAFALSFPVVAMAAPTVTFQGEVTTQTCEATINGDTNSVVLLPTVATTELDAAGATAGLTPFTISVSGCQAEQTATNIATKFLGHNVTTAGNLGNIATATPAENVAIQLLSDANGTSTVDLSGGIASVPGLTLEAGETAASHQFGAQYITEGAAATAGAVTAVAEYTLSYN